MSDVISSDLSATDKDSWSTPQWLFDSLDQEFFFVADMCASNENAKCNRYFSIHNPAQNKMSWAGVGDAVFVNPPYSRGMIKMFMDKAVEQQGCGVTSVFLVPATPEASWLPIKHASEIRFITGGRVSFCHPVTGKSIGGNTKGSMVVIFRPNNLPVVTHYVDRDSMK